MVKLTAVADRPEPRKSEKPRRRSRIRDLMIVIALIAVLLSRGGFSILDNKDILLCGAMLDLWIVKIWGRLQIVTGDKITSPSHLWFGIERPGPYGMNDPMSPL